MKVVVNRDNCIGCGACESIEPNVFQLDDEGISTVIKENIETSEEESVNDAIDSCPTAAIEKDEGISAVIKENIETSEEESVNDAIDSCPTAAIEKSE